MFEYLDWGLESFLLLCSCIRWVMPNIYR